MSSSSGESIAIAAFTLISKSLLDEQHWRFFGFPARPMTGKLFRMFRSRSRVAREQALVREFPAIALSEVFRWHLAQTGPNPNPQFLARAVELTVDGYGSPLWSAYEFKNRNEAAWHFAEALKDYIPIPNEERATVFAKRTISSITKADMGVWLLGATRLFNSSESMIPHIAACMQETVHPPVDYENVALQDERYFQIVSALLSTL